MATTDQKSDVVSRLRTIVGDLSTMVGDINELNAIWLGLGMQTGGESPLVDGDIPNGPTAAQVAAALVSLNALATTYAAGSGARATIERIRP